ncbi:MAG: hypothetical protein ACXWNK_05625 [Vulcanimicrobiaceae bacterium]
MDRNIRSAAATLAVLALIFSANSSSRAAGDDDLLARMGALNPSLRSYVASVRADVNLHAFLSLSPTLQGTYYHKEPDKDKVVFTSGLPTIAKQFSKVYPHMESPSNWDNVYVVSLEGDQAGVTTFKLVPRKHGRVDHVDVKVDDKLATITQMRWSYNDGGYAQLDQTYTQVNGNYLVAQQTGHVDTPRYSADLKSEYSDFKLNVPISDTVFQQDT